MGPKIHVFKVNSVQKTHLGRPPSLDRSPDSNIPPKITAKLLRKSRSATYGLLNNRASIQEFVMTPLQVQAEQGQESHNQITHFSPDRVEIEVKK